MEPGVVNKIFLDASYLIALVWRSDQFHEAALELCERVEQNQAELITTIPILFEIGNFFSKVKIRSQGTALIDHLYNDRAIRVLEFSETSFAAALKMYNTRPDKNWGLVDCYSFSVMSEESINQALTFDDHFEQAGFRPVH
jgi:uncharacterized protein